MTEPTPLLDADAAGKLLGVQGSWMLARARAGKVPHRRLGRYVRFDQADLLAWSEQQRRGPVITPNGGAAPTVHRPRQ